MKMRRQKKGFTITELVIVIAVIAVLAAVLIPTFVSLVRKANESKDIQLVHNLNTALTVDGEEHKTMQDALNAAFDAGYDLDKINASATGNEILWDGTNDVFCYLKEGKTDPEYIPDTQRDVTDPDKITYWQICDEMPESPKYAIYAGNKWTEATVSTTVGFDAGNNKNITSVTYTGDKKATIRTNGSDVIVDNLNAEVYWYGVAGTMKVVKAAPNSVHIFGEVKGNIEISNGRVVMEQGSSAEAIKVTATEEEINNGAIISIDNTASPKTMVIIDSAVKGAIESKGGENKLNVAANSTLAYDSTHVAALDSTLYTDSTEAISNWATNGGTLRLFKDATYASNIITTRKGILDLNGKTLSLGDKSVAVKDSTADVTIKNGDLQVNQIQIALGAKVSVEYVTLNVQYSAISLLYGNTTANLKNCKITSDNYGIMAWDFNNNVTIEGCSIEATLYGVYQNGSDSPSRYTIKDTTIKSSTYPGLFISGSVENNALQTLIMENCTVTAGMTAVEIKHTNATISNCTLTATADKTAKINGNGSCTTGYGLAVTSNSASDNVTGIVTVNGGNTGDVFVFTKVEGASVKINGVEAATNTYYTTAQ